MAVISTMVVGSEAIVSFGLDVGCQLVVSLEWFLYMRVSFGSRAFVESKLVVIKTGLGLFQSACELYIDCAFNSG